MWKMRINKKILDMFPTLEQFISNNLLIKTDLTICDVGQHLESLAEHFDQHFVNDNIENFDWIHSPFDVEMKAIQTHLHPTPLRLLTRACHRRSAPHADVEMTGLFGREQEELAELSCNRSLKKSVSTEITLLFLVQRGF